MVNNINKKFFKYALISLVTIIVALIVFIAVIVVFNPNLFLNGYIKKRIEVKFAIGSVGNRIKINSLHYKFWDDIMEADTVCIYQRDSFLVCKIIGCMVNGIRFKHLINGGPTDEEVSSYNSYLKEVYFMMADSSYQLHCKAVRFSANDSTINVESIKFGPLVRDSNFFSNQKYQQTRYRIDAQGIKLSGMDYVGIIHGKAINIRSVKLNKMDLDIMIDRYKMLKSDTASSLMPNESFRLMKSPILIDTFLINEGHVAYSELFDFGGKKATVNLDNAHVIIRVENDGLNKIKNCFVNATFFVNNASPMKVAMVIPLTSKIFSMRYNGTCGRMDMTSLNPYLDIAEPMRFKAGMISSAAFDVDITSGYASGNLSVIYSNLKVEPSNQKTKQSLGKRKINSFLANVFAVRSNNLPDKKGMVKQGKIKFIRAHDTAFIDMLWLSLRSGLSDISGIKEL